MANKDNTSHLKDLLQKYHNNQITTEEFTYLITKFQMVSDDDARELFQGHWNSYEDFKELPTENIEQLYRKIRPNKRSKLQIISHYWAQIAAIILMVFSAYMTIIYHIQENEVQQLTEQTVTIRAGENDYSDVVLPDGTKVKLNAHSSLTYQQDFGRNDRQVSLIGEGYFEVEHNEEKTFIVNTKYMNVKVLGTTFNVYADENKNFTEMTLVSGKVNVQAILPPHESLNVKPNEKVTYFKDTNLMKLEKTSGHIETAWIHHELVFRHESLENVLKVLSRKFGYKFETNSASMLKETYTGVFDDTNIENILSVLKVHFHFTYHLENHVITINYNDKQMFNHKNTSMPMRK